MSSRFFCPNPPVAGRFRLEAEEARHLLRVCRLGIGDRVELFDGRGFATIAQVVETAKDQVELVPEGSPLPDRSPPCSLTLATAVPKGERFDWLVEKATELGVARLVPLITERSVVDPRGSKLDRLRRTIIEASKQCGRNRLMALDNPARWLDLVRAESGSLRLMGDPDGQPPGRWPAIKAGSSILLAIGPEGGFTSDERDLGRDLGWRPIRFGVNVLRVETAGIAGCAAVLAKCEEPDGHAIP